MIGRGLPADPPPGLSKQEAKHWSSITTVGSAKRGSIPVPEADLKGEGQSILPELGTVIENQPGRLTLVTDHQNGGESKAKIQLLV